ncbi:hypothetical protein H8959_013544 [Pygathrix nigripes]
MGEEEQGSSTQLELSLQKGMQPSDLSHSLVGYEELSLEKETDTALALEYSEEWMVCALRSALSLEYK